MPLAALRTSRATRSFVLALAASAVGCAGRRDVSLLETGFPSTMTPSHEIPLEVVTRSTAIQDPLPIEGSDVEYRDVESSLGASVSSAAVPWAASHAANAPSASGGWQLFVELIQAEAKRDDLRLVVGFTVRATLRDRTGNRYIAQTQASCREAGLLAPSQGAPVVHACMGHLGRDLAGWLGSLNL